MRSLKAGNSNGYDIGDSRPTFSLTVDQLPEIKNWKVGNKYKMVIEVEQTSMAKQEYMKDQPLTARFRITKVASEDEDEDTKRGKKGYE